MPRALCALVLSFELSPSLIAAAQAQGTQPNGLPPGVYMGEADYKQAPAGTYTLDPDHAAVVARVSHLRYSWSIFRFDKVSGTLKWDPVAERFPQDPAANAHMRGPALRAPWNTTEQ